MHARRLPVLALLGAALLLAADARAADPDDLWAALLLRHTHETHDLAGVRVDYAAIAADSDWKVLVATLAAMPAPADAAPKAERLATWIDAYDIFAIDLVARHYPIASIRDIGSLVWPVWKREAGRIGGHAYSLDDIERGILRPIGDPRVHMAIVCASTSCPSLAREPFVAARLDAQLDVAAARFVANPEKGVRVEAHGVRLSKIFDWFAEDFAAGGGVLAFVRRYASPELVAALDRLGPDPALSYFVYDWSLNGGDSQPADWAGR